MPTSYKKKHGSGCKCKKLKHHRPDHSSKYRTNKHHDYTKKSDTKKNDARKNDARKNDTRNNMKKDDARNNRKNKQEIDVNTVSREASYLREEEHSVNHIKNESISGSSQFGRRYARKYSRARHYRRVRHDCSDPSVSHENHHSHSFSISFSVVCNRPKFKPINVNRPKFRKHH